MRKILIEQICVKNIDQVPGHSPRLQLDDSNDIPEQSDPLFLGTGSLQNLDLILEPVSQVRLQVDHVSHAPHSPFTKLRFEVSAFIDCQNLVWYNIKGHTDSYIILYLDSRPCYNLLFFGFPRDRKTLHTFLWSLLSYSLFLFRFHK